MASHLGAADSTCSLGAAAPVHGNGQHAASEINRLTPQDTREQPLEDQVRSKAKLWQSSVRNLLCVASFACMLC